MLPAENEKRKQELFALLHSDTRRLSEVFPDIEGIIISYDNHHKSILDEKSEKNDLPVTPHSIMDFSIPCLNTECTYGWFDLKNEIYSMRREHLTEFTGKQVCRGYEAPDHPEEKCGSYLNYTIRIIYK